MELIDIDRTQRSAVSSSISPVMDLSSCLQVRGFVTIAEPYSGCSEITNAEYVQGHIALLQRGQCMFAEKARHVQKAGAIGGIVIGECKQLMEQNGWLFND